jgi:tetratricopeptide (TPR) repeat protein
MSVAERLIELDRTNGEGWVMRGVSLARMGRVKEAEFFLTAKITRSSKIPLVWQLFGEYYFGLGRTDEAETNYRKALELDPDHTGSLFGLIKIYSAQKKYHEVITLCDAALKSDSADQGIILRKGDAEFALGKIADAVQTYEKYLSRVPSNTGVLKCLARCQIKLKKVKDAEKSLDLLLSQGEADVQVYRLKTYLLLVSGKVRAAVEYLDKILESEPEDIWALRVKVDAHISLKEYAPALICIDQILGNEPENSLMLEKKGKILLSLGFSAESVSYLKHAIERGRMSADLCILYGDAIRTQGNTRYGFLPPALERKDSGMLMWRVNHQYADLWYMVDVSPSAISSLAQTMEWYDQAITIGGDEAAIWNRKGIVVAMLRDFNQARGLIEKAVQTNKGEPAYLTNLAVVDVLAGENDRAASVFLQGMSRFSKNPYFLDQCAGFYYTGKKDLVTALDLIEQAVQYNSNRDPNILYHKMVILLSAGKETEAGEVARIIHRIDPWFILSYDEPVAGETKDDS